MDALAAGARPALLRRARHAAPAGRSAAPDPAECLGALWLELAATGAGSADPSRAVRRAWYEEFERWSRRAPLPLPAEVAAPPRRSTPIPEGLKPWIEELLRAAPLPGRVRPATRALGLTRAHLRLRATAIWRALGDDSRFSNVRRRAARLCARAAREGHSSRVRGEARLLCALLSVLEVPADIARLRAVLRPLATGPGRPSATAQR